jgi:hypothetical protein
MCRSSYRLSGFQEVEAAIFIDSQHMRVVRLSAQRTGCLHLPEKSPGTRFCYGPGSSVGIATDYGLDGPRSNSGRGGEIFRICPDRPWDPPSLLYSGYRVFSGVKSGRCVTLTPHPF